MNRYRFWHVSDASGSMVHTEIEERPLNAKMLTDDDSYILELYDTIYVWQGKHASASEKHNGIAFAKKMVKDNNKPRGTHITRLPQGTEDSVFKSYFEEFYAPVKFVSGEPFTTEANQDIEKMLAQEKKAASLTLDKLGGSFSYKLYRMSEDLKTPHEVTGPIESMFLFAEDVYVVDVIGPNHRYVLLWCGKKLGGSELQQAQTGMDKLTDGEHSTHITYMTIRKGHEDEAFMQFFKFGLIILDGDHRALAEWKAGVEEKGTMFRI